MGAPLFQEKETRLDLIYQKYLNTLRYSTQPMGAFWMKASKLVTLGVSGVGTGYLFYWIFVQQLPALPAKEAAAWWERVYWSILILSLLLGLAMSISLNLMKYSSTKKRVDQEAAGGDPAPKGMFRRLFMFEPNFGLFSIRLTNIIGMILFGYGVLDNFNERIMAEAEMKEKTATAYEQNRIDIDSLQARIERNTQKLDNGTRDDDAEAKAMLDILRPELRKRLGATDSLAFRQMASVGHRAQIVDNTAWVRFLAGGRKLAYGILITLIIAIAANAIDASSVIIIEGEAEGDYHRAIKREYEAQLAMAQAAQEQTELFLEAGRNGPGNSLGVDFKNPKNMMILEAVKTRWKEDKTGDTLDEIANDFQCKKQWVHKIKVAAIEEGLVAADYWGLKKAG